MLCLPLQVKLHQAYQAPQVRLALLETAKVLL
jgi:hypothetical protein